MFIGMGIRFYEWSIKSWQSGINWGDVGGTLSTQTDLQGALDDKANTADLGDAAFLDVGTADGEVAAGDHTHTGVYEPADATILKDADIGVNIEAYNVNIQTHVTDVTTNPHAVTKAQVGLTNVPDVNVLTGWGNPKHGYFFGGFPYTNGYIYNSSFTAKIRAATFFVNLSANNKTIVNFGTNMTISVNSSNVVTLGSALTNATIYVNGVVSTAFTLNQRNHIAVVFDEITPTTYELGKLSTTYMNGVISEFRTFNYAITAAKVTKLYNNGQIGGSVDFADKYANYSFYVSDFGSSVTGWVATNATAAADIDSISDGTTSYDDNFRMTMGGTGNNERYISLNATTAYYIDNPCPYRISFQYYIPTANAEIARIAFDTGAIIQSFTVTGTWTDVTLEFTPTYHRSIPRFYGYKSNGSVGSVACVGDLVYIRNMRIEKLGAMVDLDMETGGSYSVFDKANGFHGTVSGAVPLSRNRKIPAHKAGVTGDTTLTNVTTYGYLLKDCLLETTADVTVSLGTTAGGTDIINAQAVVAGTPLYLELNKYLSNTLNKTLYLSSADWNSAVFGIKMWEEDKL